MTPRPPSPCATTRIPPPSPPPRPTPGAPPPGPGAQSPPGRGNRAPPSRSRTAGAAPGDEAGQALAPALSCLVPGANETIPVIDLGPCFAGEPGALDRAAAELRHALTEIGFYFIVNHGIPRALIQEAFRQAARFHGQPIDEKMKIRIDRHNVGYLPMKGDTLRTSVVQAVTKPNLHEALFVARDLLADHPAVLADRRFRSANQWPSNLPGFRGSVMTYCDALERL